MPETYSEYLDTSIAAIDASSTEFLSYVNDMTDDVSDYIGGESGTALRGTLGNSMLSSWNNKKDDFLYYYKVYQIYVSVLNSVSSNNKGFIEETEASYSESMAGDVNANSEGK